MGGHLEPACFTKMLYKAAGKKKGSKAANLVSENESSEEAERESDASPVGGRRSQTPGPTKKGCRVSSSKEEMEVVQKSGSDLMRLEGSFQRKWGSVAVVAVPSLSCLRSWCQD